jgi:hypothetical protein
MLRLVANNRPPPGWEWNPLKTLPRNMKCPCKSGVKFKHCCLNKLAKFVTERDATMYREAFADGRGIHFNMTP